MAIIIKAKQNDTNDSLMRAFKKKVLEEDILAEVRRRQFYQKPSQIRKEKKKELEHRKKVMIRWSKKRKAK